MRYLLMLICTITIIYSGKLLPQNSDGISIDTAWVRHFTSGGRATAIAVDASGNAYITGTGTGSGSWSDYITVKYNTEGVVQWVAHYDGMGHLDDWAEDLALDSFGNVYVTGWSEGSDPGCDYATVKYNPDGIEQWSARYNGPGNSQDYAEALMVDGNGNIFVTGRSEGSSTSTDFATVKYDSQGVEQWVARYNGPGNYGDGAMALKMDTNGNVCVTGWSVGSGTESDYATVKYNSEGVEQWVARYNGPGNSQDYTEALAVDDFGNVYVTGASWGSDMSFDYATVKYNSQGVEQWVARYTGSNYSDDMATDLAVDASGNVYVTGGTGSAYATVKYNSEGAQQWVAYYSGPPDSIIILATFARDLAMDAQDNIYVTGASWGSGSLPDYATVKYNSEGVEQWVARYDMGDDRAEALALDSSGNVYVTGMSMLGSSHSDYTTIKYVQTLVTIKKKIDNRPTHYRLSQNYPNPFNPTTNIEFSIPRTGLVTLQIYNTLGEKVTTLVSEKLSAGRYRYQWDGSGLASGMYIYELQAGNFSQTCKMLLMR